MPTLHSVWGKKEVFASFLRREHFYAVFKTSFSFFWYLTAGSGETCWSSPRFTSHFMVTLFWHHRQQILLLCGVERTLGSTASFLSGEARDSLTMWFLLPKCRGMIGENETWQGDHPSLGTGSMSDAMDASALSSFWTRPKINQNPKGSKVLFLASGIWENSKSIAIWFSLHSRKTKQAG